jgi:hypothetical protein
MVVVMSGFETIARLDRPIGLPVGCSISVDTVNHCTMLSKAIY